MNDSNNHSEPDYKRVRIEEGVVKATTSINANEVIRFHFIDCGGVSKSENCKGYRPLFSHQVFDEEIMELGTCCTDNHDDAFYKIDIYITTRGLLSTTVKWSDAFCHEDRSRIYSILEKVLPLAPDRPATSASSFPVETWQHVDTFKCHDHVNRNEDNYSIYSTKHNSHGACELLAQSEKMALWYIETAESIDFNDDRWECLFLYHSTGEIFNYVGFCTLYTFNNPIYGSRVRICSLFIIPTYQRIGLGYQFLLRTYRWISKRIDVTQITVESPCEDFRRLRDRVDLSWSLERNVLSHNILELMRGACLKLANEDNNINVSHNIQILQDWKEYKLSSQDIQKVSTKAIITSFQSLFILQCIAYTQVLLASDGDDNLKSNLKSYRNDAKRRILLEPENADLKLLDTYTLKQELSKLYDEHIRRIHNVIRYSWRIHPTCN